MACMLSSGVAVPKTFLPNDEMAHHIAVNEGLDQAWVPLYEEDIAAILRDCL